MPDSPTTNPDHEDNQDSPGARLLGDLVLSGDPQRMITVLHFRLSPYLRLSGISCRLDGAHAGFFEVGESCESTLVLSVSTEDSTMGEVAWYRSEPFEPEEEELLFRTTRLLARALEQV